jgi:hypothetical protein
MSNMFEEAYAASRHLAGQTATPKSRDELASKWRNYAAALRRIHAIWGLPADAARQLGDAITAAVEAEAALRDGRFDHAQAQLDHLEISAAPLLLKIQAQVARRDRQVAIATGTAAALVSVVGLTATLITRKS